MRKIVSLAALLASTAPAFAGDAAPSYLETLAACRRLVVAGEASPECVALVEARDAEPRPYSGNVDFSLPVYSTDAKERIAQRNAASAAHVARIHAQSAERIARQRDDTARSIADDHNATSREIAAERNAVTLELARQRQR